MTAEGGTLNSATAIRALTDCGAITAALRAEHSAIEDGLQTLGDAVLAGANTQVLTQVISMVVHFCEAHFANEEEAFSVWGYAEVGAHASAHQGLLNAFRAARIEVAAGCIDATLTVSDLLNGFHDHIARFDRPAYVEMLKQNIEHGGGTPRELTELDLLTRGDMLH
jgi:hemerythrin